MAGGRPLVFALGARADWLAVDAKRTAPDDLSRLSDDALAGLYYRALRLAALSGGRDTLLAERVTAERRRRSAAHGGEHADARGGHDGGGQPAHEAQRP